MLELIAAWAGGLLIGAALIAGWARRRIREARPSGTTLTFEEVCHAAARAKEDRRQEEHLSSDYVDGTDGVLAELLADRDVSPEEMQTAYHAGGEEVTLER